MWAPKKESKIAAALERCVRVYPHQQNTGGFFVAIIRKVRP
jgi:16S rRNA C967 or C1407 C5-methylase (RsmB/RsmF family)